ncbi:hypothetical protein CTEN210_16290 [Chaetoceros tenuissimus]|uniref:PsbP C-terminal domain-containing protein n=1 Tax=Chaetoceros tenuissimus TaxID=426638 RepID=A0AAD3D8J1_9STRA|nr:hypothetical protein CTEN210_16290 [Chaetoceros tenuissimus]
MKVSSLTALSLALAFQNGKCFQVQKPHRISPPMNQTPSDEAVHVTSRKQFNKQIAASLASLTLLMNNPESSQALAGQTGGVGGLGKTKPQTGVVFASEEANDTSIQIPGTYNTELIGPDGTNVLLSFYAAWPMLKSQGIESRDLANAEASFVQVASKPAYYVEGGEKAPTLKKSFFTDTILAQTGKFGAYGQPTDVKVSKVDNNGKRDLYLLSFTTLTPAMRESDRKYYVSCKVIGESVYMLVTGTTLGRFKSQENLLKKISDSFEVVEAPKSSLRR